MSDNICHMLQDNNVPRSALLANYTTSGLSGKNHKVEIKITINEKVAINRKEDDKMRKTLKSALSVLLSAAMALTSGIGINRKPVVAKADSLQWTGFISMATDWKGEAVEVKSDERSTIALTGNQYNNFEVDMKVDLSAFDDPTITVTAAANEGMTAPRAFAVCDSSWNAIVGTMNDFSRGEEGISANQTEITGKLDKNISDYLITAQGRTITKIVISDGKAAAPSAAGYIAHLAFADATWNNSVWNAGEANDAVVDLKEGSATYTVSANNRSGAAANGAVVFCVDIDGLYKAAADAGLAVTLEDISVKLDNIAFPVDNAKVITGDIEEKGNYRIELYNEYSTTREAPAVDTSKMSWSNSLAVTFTVNIGKAVKQPANDGKPDFNAAIKCYGNFYGWDSDTPTDATATVHISDFGQYSVSFIAPSSYVDLNELSGVLVVQTDLTGEPSAHSFTLLAKTVKIGYTSYDWSKAVAYLDGDNIRMSARNEWDKDEEANPLAGQVIPINKDQLITFTFEVKEGAPVENVPTEEPTAAPTADTARVYNAYLGFQVPGTWDYRNSYEEDAKSTYYDFATQAMVGAEATDISKVKIKNASITKDGTYSVSMTGADLSGGTEFNMLYISTDIPATMKNVKFTDIKVILDGTEVATLSEGAVKKEVQEGTRKYYQIMVINTYGTIGVDLPKSFAYTMPVYSVELQFRVSGLSASSSTLTDGSVGKKNQTIHAKKSITKEYGSKLFSLGASLDSQGKLIYSSSNKKVVTVDTSGWATVKGYGQSTITIEAPETKTYKKATKKITVKVVPKKVVAKTLKSPEAKKVFYSWEKDKTVSGYQIYASLKKDFSSETFSRIRKSALSLNGLKSGKTYYFKVRAYKLVGKKKYYGRWSNVRKVKIK